MASELQHQTDPANPAYCTTDCPACAEEVRNVEGDLEERPPVGSLSTESAAPIAALRREVACLGDQVSALTEAVTKLSARLTTTDG